MSTPGAPLESDQQRRLRLDSIFGDVLPELTRDERPTEREDGSHDADPRRDVPPHHG